MGYAIGNSILKYFFLVSPYFGRFKNFDSMYVCLLTVNNVYKIIKCKRVNNKNGRKFYINKEIQNVINLCV